MHPEDKEKERSPMGAGEFTLVTKCPEASSTERDDLGFPGVWFLGEEKVETTAFCVLSVLGGGGKGGDSMDLG